MKNSFWLVVAVLISGCHSNPYSGVTGDFDSTLKVTKPVVADFPIKAQSIVDATEGQTVTANVRGFVQNGDGVFTFENLPTWVAFDRGQLTISPPLGASNAITNGEYTFNIVLTSSIDHNENYKKDMTVVVHKAAQSLSVTNFDQFAFLHEGQTYTSNVKVTTSYFPVQISGVNLPDGMKIASTADPTVFTVTYKPPFTAVTQNEHQDECLDTDGFTSRWCNTMPWTLTVIDSQGFSKSVAAAWKVLDMRQDPIIRIVTTPNILTVAAQSAQGGQAGTLTAKFSIDIEDPNGEFSPDVSIQNSNLPGNFTTDISAQGAASQYALPYSLINVTWLNIPAELRTTSQTITVNACVVGGPSQQSHCASLPMAINL